MYMIYNLPELDRMSRALSRLETALLTKRTVSSASRNALIQGNDNANPPLDMAQENQMLRLQCEEMRGQLKQAHLLLAEILGHDINIDALPSGANSDDKNKLESSNSSANKIHLNDLRNTDDEEYNG